MLGDVRAHFANLSNDCISGSSTINTHSFCEVANAAEGCVSNSFGCSTKTNLGASFQSELEISKQDVLRLRAWLHYAINQKAHGFPHFRLQGIERCVSPSPLKGIGFELINVPARSDERGRRKLSRRINHPLS